MTIIINIFAFMHIVSCSRE